MINRTMRRQRGLSLMESLVALFVTALGILGVLAVQMRTLTDTQTTVRRAQAVRLIEDLSERMTVNPNALNAMDSYISAWGASPAAGANCASAVCTPAQLAAYDIADWKRAVQRTLPAGDANVFLAPGDNTGSNRRQLGVMISWRQNEKNLNNDLTNPIDATQVLANDLSLSSGTGGNVMCPTNATCHLQYIPLTARCTPYIVGTAVVPQYYCAGN